MQNSGNILKKSGMEETVKKAIWTGTCMLAMSSLLCSCVDSNSLKSGEWTLSYDNTTNGIDIYKGGKPVFDNLYAAYRRGDSIVLSRNYRKASIDITPMKDAFGEGFHYRITYSDKKLPLLVQTFYVYPAKDYILTDFMLEDVKGVASNYMAPVNADCMPQVLSQGADNRALFIPFDNDCWIRYRSCPLSFDELTSYEVTAIYNNDNREALVVGSVEHDNWKTGVTMGKGDANNIGSLKCFGGVADKTTRDSKSHGTMKGTSIKSPKIMLGRFYDWRLGMEEFADANAIIAPPKAWGKAVPFGWNSWGALQFNLRFPKTLEVSDFYYKQLQPNHFLNADNLVYIGLDSGWNIFSEKELKDFVDRCKANGQVAGVYWTPFTDWGKNLEREIKEVPGCRYRDVYLYANGKPQELDGAYALDPTHPAVESMMKKTSELFHRVGFEYVKMDFMTHGAMEADKWYNPEIRTGMQGYNYGMKLLDKYFGDMYINLSISPIFPANYAQSRRIACDAWNKIKDTEYTLNALSYGWWQDRVYQFNDPDHIVLRDATEGENRARVTSGMITGIFIAGDDLSDKGPEEAKEKAMKFLTNKRINAVANGYAFRPLTGNGEKSEFQFVRSNKNGITHYAVFNYTEKELVVETKMEDLGLRARREYTATELWSGKHRFVKGSMSLTVPPCDAFIYEMELKTDPDTDLELMR